MEQKIPSEKMQEYIPRLEAIASAWAYNEGTGKENILSRLIDHAERGWLSSDWVNGAYAAILDKKHLEFYYDAKQKTTIWIAGKSPEQVRSTLRKAIKNGFNLREKRN